MSAAPAPVKREAEGAGVGLGAGVGAGDGARHKRRKQAAPSRAPPHAAPPPLAHTPDLAKIADAYRHALAFGADVQLPFDPLAAYRTPRPADAPRIFNPEAYCDLCCKEFCNKYFLKTHRANKHGIYESGEEPRPDPLRSDMRRASDEESLTGGVPPRRLSPDSAQRARDANFAPDALRRLGVLNPEAFCEICCKEYCNKYFLRTHRERRHGAPPSSPPRIPLSLLPPSMAQLQPVPPISPRSPPVEPTSAPSPIKREYDRDDFSSGENRGEYRDSAEYRDEVQSPERPLRDSQTSPLNLAVEERGGIGSGEASPASASEELRKLQTMIAQLNELAAERLADESEGTGGLGEGSRPPSPGATDASRSGSGSGSSFCDICNKELCNKYFMRTHMQRMHGISLEGGAQLGGVTCDICHKELCSKYFLRVHKHNTHGVPAPPGAQAPQASEQCPLCARRFRAPRALRAHLLTEHAPPGAQPSPLSLTPAPVPSSAEPALDLLTADKPYGCSYCPFTTNVLAFLFAHERAHAQATTPVRGDRDADEGAEEEAEAFSCSRCGFRATAFTAMEAHLRAAHGAGGALLAGPRPPGRVTMQPFVLEEAAAGGALVPALVFLPVRRRATRKATVTFTLTPA